MDIENLGSIGEFVSGIAVIISLVYLAQQIRSSSRATRFDSHMKLRLLTAESQKNLKIVTDAYSRGALTILDLLDAQNVALISEERAANSTYKFLIDFMNLQRAVGTFDLLSTPSEIAVFRERLKNFVTGEKPKKEK